MSPTAFADCLRVGQIIVVRPVAAPKNSIFINYRRADSGYAVGRLYERFTGAFGQDAVFRDIGSISPGDDFPQRIAEALNHCTVVLVIVGRDWFRILQERNPPDASDTVQDHVRAEIEVTLRRRSTDKDVLVYPILLLNASIPPGTALPPSIAKLAELNATTIGIDPDFDRHVDDVIAQVATHLNVTPKPWHRSPRPAATFEANWNDELRTYGDGFAGREIELEALDDAWSLGKARVFCLWAEGGAGKTRLLVKWLSRVRDDGWRGAGGVFVHSFYSQGSDEHRSASSDLFFERALKYFGYEGERIVGTREQARELARRIVERKALLILDGIEPLQHPLHHFEKGGLKDPGIDQLLRSLSNATGDGTRGLCILTSRQPVVELEDRTGLAIVQKPLNRLDRIAGAALLRQLKVAGTESQMRDAVDDFHGHAYTLMLLGTYLKDATDDHDIETRHQIPLLDEDAEHRFHARHMFGAYVQHLGETSPEVAVLRLLGFFDRAVDLETLDVLQQPQADAMSGITEPLDHLSPTQFQRVLSRLRDLRLVAGQENDSQPAVKMRCSAPVDSHPLLRQYFASRLLAHHPEPWRCGHRRLYNYLGSSVETFPKTFEGISILLAAVGHGCTAGDHERAFREVFVKRICQDEDLPFVSRKLGGYAAELACLYHFYERAWSKVVAGLPYGDAIWILNETALCLASLGRSREALEVLKLCLRENLVRKQLIGASTVSINLAGQYLQLGEISSAIRCALDAGEYVTAINLSDGQQRFRESQARAVAGFVVLADSLHAAGRFSEADHAFRDAKTAQRRFLPQFSQLLGGTAFFESILLIETGRATEARRRLRIVTEEVSKIGIEQSELLDPTDERLQRFAVAYARSTIKGHRIHDDTIEQLSAEITETRIHDERPILCRMLICFADVLLRRGDLDRAEVESTEVLTIAKHSGMRLFEADAELLLARIQLARGNPYNAKEYFRRAKKLIVGIGYGRHFKQIKRLERALKQ